jgi:hypothetical protein
VHTVHLAQLQTPAAAAVMSQQMQQVLLMLC